MAKELSKIRTKEIESDAPKKLGFWSYVWLPTALLLALSAGGLTGILASTYLNNSRYATEVSALATYRPPQVTTIYADDGETILSEFALEKRIPIKESEIPKNVEDALISIEDYRFYDHIGIDPYRIAGVVIKNITSGKTEGASTITQQLAKNLFLYKDQTYTRKVNEWMVALQIERLYTKRQILEMYMNYVFLGAGSYGFEAGARTYFGKPLKDLNLEEAALLAAIPKSPEYSPTRNMDKAKERRDTVLDQMAKYGKISQAEADAAKAKPIKLADTAYYQSLPKSTAWDYPVEEVRKYLEEKYTTRVAQGGLKVYTTINVDAQKLATKVIRDGLRQYDKGRGWRSDYQNILLDENNQPITDQKEIDRTLKSYKHADWYGDNYAKGEYIKGLVMKIDPAKDEAQVRFGRYKAIVTAKDMGRSGKKPASELKAGYLAEFEIKEVNEDDQTLQVSLSQTPEIQAAIITLNAHTGEIIAMVGGYDFHSSKFNNATQGLRQTGSAYKPFIYTAAVEWGMTPDSIVSGAPVKRGGWMPHNYDGSLSHGNVPMKIALAKSYNLAAVHLLEQVGVQTGAQMVRRFGITNPMAPSLPSALGASEVSLIEMVSAYSTFPNKGVRVTPHLIKKVLSRDGSLLEEWKSTSSRVTSEYVAGTIVEMMQGVTAPGGTAPGANAAGQPLAGKTGTVNDQTDVWFIGYTPTYVTGVWMGNPERKTSLGAGMTGGRGALPYFNAFMGEFMKDKPKESFYKAPEMPSDIKSLVEQRKREEQEKLEKADEEARKLGVSFDTGTKTRKSSKTVETDGEAAPDSAISTDETDAGKSDNNPTPTVAPRDEPPPTSKPVTSATPAKKPESPTEKSKDESTKRKGKKGDG
ncbi:MAG: PBP1A family penicillin-binding protein [Acidobacteria bacterium]|jgi:penicillin-binding protein 1A|nr:PBP1A family penicillin-binding protein [Acidobacteriota bacterium]